MRLVSVPDGRPVEASFKKPQTEVHPRSEITPMRHGSTESRPNISRKRKMTEQTSSDEDDDELSRPDAFLLFKDQEKVINRILTRVDNLQQEMASLRDAVTALGKQQDPTTPRATTPVRDIDLLMDNISQVSSRVGEFDAVKFEVKMMQRRIKRIEDERQLSSAETGSIGGMQPLPPKFQSSNKADPKISNKSGLSSSIVSEASLPFQTTSNDGRGPEDSSYLSGPDQAINTIDADVPLRSLEAVPSSETPHHANVSTPITNVPPPTVNNGMLPPEPSMSVEIKMSRPSPPTTILDSQEIQTELLTSLDTSRMDSPPTVLDSQGSRTIREGQVHPQKGDPSDASHDIHNSQDQSTSGAESTFVQPLDSMPSEIPPDCRIMTPGAPSRAPVVQMIQASESQTPDHAHDPVAQSEMFHKSPAPAQTLLNATPDPCPSNSTPMRTTSAAQTWTPRFRRDGSIDRRSLRHFTPAQRSEVLHVGTIESPHPQSSKRRHVRLPGARDAEGYLLKPDGSRDRRSTRVLDEARRIREGTVDPKDSWLGRRLGSREKR